MYTSLKSTAPLLIASCLALAGCAATQPVPYGGLASSGQLRHAERIRSEAARSLQPYTRSRQAHAASQAHIDWRKIEHAFLSTASRFDLAGGPYNLVQAARGKEGAFTGSVM